MRPGPPHLSRRIRYCGVPRVVMVQTVHIIYRVPAVSPVQQQSDGRMKYNLSVPPIGNRRFHIEFSETTPQACHF